MFLPLHATKAKSATEGPQSFNIHGPPAHLLRHCFDLGIDKINLTNLPISYHLQWALSLHGGAVSLLLRKQKRNSLWNYLALLYSAHLLLSPYLGGYIVL